MINIGMIGTGHGLRTIKPAFEYTKKAKVIAVSGSSATRSQEVADENGIEIACNSAQELCDLEELDLICVASPNVFHLKHSQLALKSGKHVYLEKPVGINAKEAKKLLAQQQKYNVPRHVFVGHQLRFNPFVQELNSLIRNKTLGDVYSVSVAQRGGAFANQTRPWTWEFEESLGGGVRLAMATHLLDLSNFILNSSPVDLSISADPVHSTRKPKGERERAVRVSNFCSLDVDYGKTYAQLSTSAASHVPGYFRLEVLCSHGAAIYDGWENLKIFREGQLDEQFDYSSLIAEFKRRPGSSVFRKSLTYFAEQIVSLLEGEIDTISGAHSLMNAVQLMTNLDNAYQDFKDKVNPPREAF